MANGREIPGGILDKGVTKKTSYLILGSSNNRAILQGGKSSKHKKAEQLKLNGSDKEVIDEYSFYGIVSDEGV